MEALSTLTDSDMLPKYDNTLDKIDIATWFSEHCVVAPDVSTIEDKGASHDEKLLSVSSKRPYKRQKSNKLSSNSSVPSNSMQIKMFLVFDEKTGRLRRPLLHEFIRTILENVEYSHIAEYIDRKQGIFKLYQPDEIAELWKQVKGRNSDNNMTYDKLARALRYYYGNGIMYPNPGRFTFRFGPKSGFGISWWPADY
ncbi:unnamed protein product [Rotaria sp. Silwood2]|nr:unnamed protein product [Rotaria sp. Silwood2]